MSVLTSWIIVPDIYVDQVSCTAGRVGRCRRPLLTTLLFLTLTACPQGGGGTYLFSIEYSVYVALGGLSARDEYDDKQYCGQVHHAKQTTEAYRSTRQSFSFRSELRSASQLDFAI